MSACSITYLAPDQAAHFEPGGLGGGTISWRTPDIVGEVRHEVVGNAEQMRTLYEALAAVYGRCAWMANSSSPGPGR